MRLKRKYFARSRDRETVAGGFLTKTSSSINYFNNTIIAKIFAPALMVTSLTSHLLLLMLANILLCFGFTLNFLYRSTSLNAVELILFALIIGGIIAAAVYFFPAILGAWNFIQVLGLINYIATGLNSFFVIQDFVIPPLKRLLETCAQFFGFENFTLYYSQAPLSLDGDKVPIRRLFRRYYPHKNINELMQEGEAFEHHIRPFNALLEKLVYYRNKWTMPWFGSVMNADKLAKIDVSIDKLVIHGSAADALLLMEEKLNAKQSKIDEIQGSIAEVRLIDENTSIGDMTTKLRFFDDVPADFEAIDRNALKQKAETELQTFLDEQLVKIESLEVFDPARLAML